MFCPNCGVSVADDEARCPACNFDLREGMPAKIPNYFAGSILITLFCCVPLGIVALVYSSQVNSKLAAGDVIGAQKASKTVKQCIIAGVVFGLLILLFYILTAIAGAGGR